MTSRQKLFLLLCVACAASAGAYFYAALQRTTRSTPQPQPQPSVAKPSVIAVSPPVKAERRRLLFSSTDAAHYGELASIDLGDGPAAATRFYTRMNCLQMDFRHGQGICLRVNMVTPGYATDAVLFDAHFQIRHVIPLAGILSRTRVSPDGKWGAATVFTQGDSYANQQMSTRTTLFDMDHGTVLADLEEFSVQRDGQPFKAVDFNFWGVTFANDNRHFYATLSSGGTPYLIKGDRVTKQAQVITTGVECPSLSPDNRHIAFKKLDPKNTFEKIWHIAVLDLATLQVTDLAEPKPIDQQVQWLDNQHVLYTLPENDKIVGGGPIDAWSIPADGSGPPKKLLPLAASPVVL